MLQHNSHLDVTKDIWENLQQFIDGEAIKVDGQTLRISHVVAASRHGCVPYLTTDRSVIDGINASVDVLMDHLAKGYYVYGVNTGFGGSADSRTESVFALQAALLQLTQAGILTKADKESGSSNSSESDVSKLSMPAAWVKAIMLVRCNVTARGHSAVSLPVLHSILSLFENKITPVVPLRGSVSASGDLMPLAYIAGAIEGSTDVFVEVATEPGQPKVMTARDALHLVGANVTTLGPKEGLGLVNGTAASAALAALAMFEANNLAVLTQALTAMACEALLGNSESFHPFIAEVRPHEGQIESARNIFTLLQGSHLAQGIMDKKNRKQSGLIQNRYALRSAPQWIGPQLEDLMLANRQVQTELNSSCDNPLVDRRTEDIYYGANFQATSITSAMEKTRLSLQMFGKLLFSQATEMIDPNLSNGLPTNLVADDPSLSFTMKGVDISMAAYMSELAYLASPISSHVQAAEMHNQSINSMAFVSGRLTMQAVELLSMISACSLYVCCQALDLRVMHLTFMSELRPVLRSLAESTFSPVLPKDMLEDLYKLLDDHVTSSWLTSSQNDIHERIRLAIDSTLAVVLQAIITAGTSPSTEGTSFGSATTIGDWKSQAADEMQKVYTKVTETFFKVQNTPDFLGGGSKSLYHMVRRDLGVPFHLGLVEHPTAKNSSVDGRAKRTVSSWISVLYEAIRAGKFQHAVLSVLSEDNFTRSEAATQAKRKNGVNRMNEMNGANGTNGTNGTNRTNGTNGANGANGTNGTKEVNGRNGANGFSNAV